MSSTESIAPPPYAEEILESNSVAADNLMSMVIGALQDAQMPPRPVFEWAMHNVAFNLAHIEHFVLMSETEDEERSGALKKAVEMMSSMLGIAQKNKMFGVVASTEQILNTRKIRYPTHMDLTYGGLLP